MLFSSLSSFAFFHNLSPLIQLLTYSSTKKTSIPNDKSLVTTNSRSFTAIFFLEFLNFSQLKLRRTQIPSNSKKKLFSLLRILRPKHSNQAQIFSPSKTITTNSGIRSENHCFLRNQNPNPNEYPPKLFKDLKTGKQPDISLIYREESCEISYRLGYLFQIGIRYLVVIGVTS